MATPRWADYRELRDYANHPDGNEDIGNRAMKDFYGTLGEEHNDDGTHKLQGFMLFEQDSYDGDGSPAAQVISLTDTDLLPKVVLISRADTIAPFITVDAASGTKVIGTNALQTNYIIDMSTAGQFTVSGAANVAAVKYYYAAYGVEG